MAGFDFGPSSPISAALEGIVDVFDSSAWENKDINKLKKMYPGIKFDPITGVPIAPEAYQAQMPSKITGFDIAQGPIGDTYLAPDKSISSDIESYLSKALAPSQGLYGQAAGSIEALKRMAESEGPTAYGKAQLSQQGIEQSRATDLAQRQAAQQQAAQQQALAMRGGLGGGSRERLAGFGQQAALGALQDVAGRGEQARAGIGASDAAFKQGLLTALPGQYSGLAGAQGQLGLGAAGQIAGAKQFDVGQEAQRQRSMAELKRQQQQLNLGYLTGQQDVTRQENLRKYQDALSRFGQAQGLYGAAESKKFLAQNPGLISGV